MPRYIHTCTIQKRTLGTINSSNEKPGNWTDDQTDVACRFYTDTGPVVVLGSGQFEQMSTKVNFPPGVIIDSVNYRIVTTQPGFEGNYRIKGSVHSVYGFNQAKGVHHLEAELQTVKVPA